jgi:hypothetical protein
MVSQRYEILHAISNGDEIAVEVRWTGKLALPVGSLEAGATMAARFAIFIRFAEGKIARQRNYDCFETF